MLRFEHFSKKFFSALTFRPAPADVGTLRQLCTELLADVPLEQRVSMMTRLGTMRRASDMWPLRTALFDVIAHHWGEQVAASRLVELDRMLAPYAKLSNRRP